MSDITTDVEIHIKARDGSILIHHFKLPRDEVAAGIYDYAQVEVHQPDKAICLGWLGDVTLPKYA